MNFTYFLFFICIIACALIITNWAAERSSTTFQFYTAAGRLTGIQNGMAIAGDYISAASFLGIVGAIALNGYDGFLYSLGFLASYLVVLLFVAEPVHHLGKYSLADVICTRFPSNRTRFIIAISSFIISVFYMIPQLVASGLIIRLLLQVDYSMSVLVIGSLMTVYVVFGGMVATSWVQIVKTILLMSSTFLLSLIVFSYYNWDIRTLIDHVKVGTPLGDQFFISGHLLSNPIEMISLYVALILGTAGLPHILIRFYTVKNATEVRKSVLSASWIIGFFYLITLVLGLGVAAVIGYDQLIVVDSTGNLAAPLLAKALGGDFLLAFIAAVAFTTVVAVVAGLVISASTAFSYDIYHHIIKKGKTTEKEQLRAAQWSALAIGLISTLFALGLKNSNVTFLVSLTFIIAASSNLPVILLTIYWKRFSQTGAIIGLVSGLVASLTLLFLGPHIMHMENGWILSEPIVHLYNPGIITIPIGFLGAIIGSLLFPDKKQIDFDSFYMKAQMGMDIRRDNR
ncbi:MAG TPA: cation acetate symporter [Pseudogracilibacillus sp.]|nr:cation acetate symporter [Pseudogracilibacillus sp.]